MNRADRDHRNVVLVGVGGGEVGVGGGEVGVRWGRLELKRSL